MTDLGGLADEQIQSPPRKKRKVEATPPQTSPLVSLPQFLIDSIAINLDIRSLIRLQMTCRDLSVKCLKAHRLKEVNLSRITVHDDIDSMELFIGAKRDEFQFDEVQFGDTEFRFHAKCLIFPDLEEIGVSSVNDSLIGRGTVDSLRIDARYTAFEEVPEFLGQVHQMIKMTVVQYMRIFPLPIDYLAETAFEKCFMNCRRDQAHSSGLNAVLQKWADGQRVIKDWDILIYQLHEGDLLKDFYIAPKEGIHPAGRPLAIRSYRFNDERGYTLERADGAELYLQFNGYRLKLKDTPFEEEEFDSDVDSENIFEFGLDYSSDEDSNSNDSDSTDSDSSDSVLSDSDSSDSDSSTSASNADDEGYHEVAAF